MDLITLEQFGIITGIISAFCAGGYFIYSRIDKKCKSIRNKINGVWENAGEADPSGKDTHNLKLELEVDLDDGEINGVVKSECLSTGSTSALCSVVGKLRYNSSKIKIWHCKHYGETIFCGEVKLTYTKKNLVWKIMKNHSEPFPKYTILFKNST